MMGAETKKAPPLPAPTETTLSASPTDLTYESAIYEDDVAHPADEASHLSLPDDGSPVTIKTRGHRANRSQTSLLIEYFEGGKSSVTGVERKPSVRVRLTPSGKKNKHDHIQITETKGSRAASVTRRIPLASGTTYLDPEALEAAEDGESMRSYASATEESNVSRNPIDIEIDRGSRRRRPASPLIPDADLDTKQSSFLPQANMSDISAIPTDSFLDGSGPTNSSREVDSKRSRSPSRGAQVAAGAAGAVAGAALADKMKNAKIRSDGKERAVLPKTDKVREKDRKHRSGRSRTSSFSEKPGDGTRSPRRRSSRSHADAPGLPADSSIVSSNLDQYSVRSGQSKSSINNPKLLETVEDAIRRLILPELSALKREQSKRETTRRGSFTSSGTGTSISREDLSMPERRRVSSKSDRRRDREARHDYADSQFGVENESVDDLSVLSDDYNRRPTSGLKAATAGATAAGLAATALAAKSPASDDRRQRRRRRADGSARSRSLGREKYAEEFEEEEEAPAPPMPLMSEINPSDLTRTSILSVESDRPHSAVDEASEVSRGGPDASDLSTGPPPPAATLQRTLGTRHANVSHGDLRELPQTRTGEYEDQKTSTTGGYQQPHDDYDDDLEYDSQHRGHPEHDYEDDYEPDGFAGDYYNTQDVPPPLKYVPYAPEQRGLSPIYSVSGTEGGSEVAGRRDSRVTNGSMSPDKHGALYSPGSDPSNVVGRGFDDRSLDDRSARSSGQDYRYTQYTDDSDFNTGHAVRGVGANPNIVNVPHGIESNVASLIEGSMLDQSVMTGASGYSAADYGNRGSTLSYDDQSALSPLPRGLSPEKQVARGHQDYLDERDGARTPTSSHHSRSRDDFAGEYDLDEYGRKVAPVQYRHSPSTSRHSPTASEKAIALGAVGAAAAALRAAKDRTQQPMDGDEQDEWVPEGVFRNKSFKERTLEGREPANTPAHSVDRLSYDERPKMHASAMPALDDPMPEIGYVDDDLSTNLSYRDDMNRTPQGDEKWAPETTPRQDEHARGLGLAAAAGAGAAAAMTHSRQASQEPDDEWQRTSTDRKRDTLITNPYENASPLANPELLNPRSLEPDEYSAGYHSASPGGQKNFDEGYISQGPIHSPNIQPKGTALMGLADEGDMGVDDPFYTNKGHMRHLSGMSQGMGSPIYDASTGAGIERIESKDIIALMQHLMVRDAQRTARDTEILVTLVRSAAEMRNSFEDMKKLLANTEDVIIKEVQDNTEETVKNHIGGPRPYPGSANRSLKTSGASQVGSEENSKKSSVFRRAFLKSFGAKDTNDLSRIEDMLNQLLAEVDTLKAQTARPAMSSGHAPSFENLQPEVPYEQDRGYEPEGHAGTSTASHASQSGQLSLAQSSRGPSSKLGYERKFSDHRISTVPEDTEEDYVPDNGFGQDHGRLTPARQEIQRGGSVPLNTPPHQMTSHSMSLSNENTPKTDKSRKHKSKGSSSWFPKISRWSESTATSVGNAFRSSGKSSKRANDDDDFAQQPPSRSGSNLGQYDEPQQYENDPYGEDNLHSGFSQPDLQMPPPPAAMYMTPEDPKYKAHRNSINLQHPQPRQGQTERFKVALESQADVYNDPMSPRSADWAGSATSLNRFPAHSNRYSGGSAGAAGSEQWTTSPPTGGPPRPPKEPLDGSAQTPRSSARVSRLQKGSPLAYQSMDSAYQDDGGMQTSNYTGSPKLENRNLNGALGVPTRRPSGPRAMTPKSPEEEAAREERRRKRDTFGTVASNETDTF